MRLFIIENGLINKVGHHFNEALGFQREARARGIETRLYVHRRAEDEVILPLGARAVFPNRPYAKRSKDPLSGPLEDFNPMSIGFADACSALTADGVARDDIVYVATALQHELYGCGLWLKTLPRDKAPLIVVNFTHENYVEATDLVEGNPRQFNIKAALHRYATKFLRQAAFDGRVIFTAPSRVMAKRLESVMLEPVLHFPMPMYYGLPEEAGGSAAETEPNGRIIVSVLGHSRDEKGWSLIPDIVRLCSEADPRVAFFIQVSPGRMAQRWGSKLDSLRATANVTLHMGSTDEDQHRHNLQRSDIVLLPYDRRLFLDKTSGVFAESVAFGKISVVPQGTWMAEQLQHGRGVGSVFENYTPASIADAVGAAVDGIDSSRTRARDLMAVWRREQSVGAFLDRLLAEVQG